MKTTIITPTTGSPELRQACISVARQIQPAQHLIVIDGRKTADHYSMYELTMGILDSVYAYAGAHGLTYKPVIMQLPWNTGRDRMNGHRIYAAAAQLVETPYFAMLDQDNALMPDWVQRMEMALHDPVLAFVTCRRRVYKQDLQTFIAMDTQESVGRSKHGYLLYDTSTWLMRTETMRKFMSAMIIPQIGDRALTEAVYDLPHQHVADYYGTFYRAPENLYDFFRGFK